MLATQYQPKLLTNYMLDDLREKFKLKPSSFVLLCFIARRGYSRGKIWWPIKKIAAACNLSIATVKRAIYFLKNLNFIQVIRKPGYSSEILIEAEIIGKAIKGEIKPEDLQTTKQDEKVMVVATSPTTEEVEEEIDPEQPIENYSRDRLITLKCGYSFEVDQDLIDHVVTNLQIAVANTKEAEPDYVPRVIEIEDGDQDEIVIAPRIIEIEEVPTEEIPVDPQKEAPPQTEAPETAIKIIPIEDEEKVEKPIEEVKTTRPPLHCLKQLEGEPDPTCFFHEGRIFKRINIVIAPNWQEKTPFPIPDGPWAVNQYKLDPGFWEWQSTLWAKEQGASITTKKAEVLNQVNYGGAKWLQGRWLIYLAHVETEFNCAVKSSISSEEYKQIIESPFKCDSKDIKFQHLQVVKYGRVLKTNPHWQTYFNKCWQGWSDPTDPDKGPKRAIAHIYKMQAYPEAIEMIGVWPRLPDEEQLKLNAYFKQDTEYVKNLIAEAELRQEKINKEKADREALLKERSSPDWHPMKAQWCRKFPDVSWEDRFTYEHPQNFLFGKQPPPKQPQKSPLSAFPESTEGLSSLEKFFVNNVI